MKKLDIDQSKSLAEREHEKFLTEYGFKLALKENREVSHYTVFQNKEILLAFTFRYRDGENLAVAELGSPVNADSIAARKDGWSLISEVWEGASDEYNEEVRKLPGGDIPDRQLKIKLVDRRLRTFMDKVRSGEVSVSHPKYRMEAINNLA